MLQVYDAGSELLVRVRASKRSRVKLLLGRSHECTLLRRRRSRSLRLNVTEHGRSFGQAAVVGSVHRAGVNARTMSEDQRRGAPSSLGEMPWAAHRVRTNVGSIVWYLNRPCPSFGEEATRRS